MKLMANVTLSLIVFVALNRIADKMGIKPRVKHVILTIWAVQVLILIYAIHGG